MNILILNGSPRTKGHTIQMIQAFLKGVNPDYKVDVINVCRKNIRGCLACEYCHTKSKGQCVQKDDMQEVYDLLKEAHMLILASPIYYHNLTGQLKCTIDRFYAIGTKENLPQLKKISMFLSSGDPDMYTGTLFSFKGDFQDYLGLKSEGIFTFNGKDDEAVPQEKLNQIIRWAQSL